MDTKTYIDKLVRECVRERKEEILREAIRPIVAQTLYEFRVDSDSNNGKGKVSASKLVRKLMKNPSFRKAAKSYLEKSEGSDKKDYDGWTNNEKTYTSLDNMSDGSKRRIVTQRLADEKMDWAPMAYRLWPDMTEDAARSWFSKKVAGKGGEEFSDDEISKLFNMLNNKI